MITSTQATPPVLIRVPAMFFSGSCIDTKLVHSSDAVGPCFVSAMFLVLTLTPKTYGNIIGPCPLMRRRFSLNLTTYTVSTTSLLH